MNIYLGKKKKIIIHLPFTENAMYEKLDKRVLEIYMKNNN